MKIGDRVYILARQDGTILGNGATNGNDGEGLVVMSDSKELLESEIKDLNEPGITVERVILAKL